MIANDNPKIESVKEIKESNLKQDLFGIKHTINTEGIIINTFTPSVNTKYDRDASKSDLEVSCDSLNTFQVYLDSTFFLPLRTSLNGFYDKCLKYLPEMMSGGEKVTVVWLFQRRTHWKEVAVSMYDSYLKGVDYPSDIKFVRRVEDGMHTFINKISSPLQKREYSTDVEDKILDDGFLFQCMVEIKSEREEVLANLIQDVLSQYDYYNRMRLRPTNYQYPYILYTDELDFKQQMLSRKEIMSLMCHDATEEDSDNVNNDEGELRDRSLDVASSDKDESTRNSEGVGDERKKRIGLLPAIENKEIDMSNNTTVKRLAEALKRTGVTNQARLYNETMEYGSRLIVIHADVPNGKNFSDVYKKLKDIRVELGAQSLGIEQGDHPGTIKYTIPHNENQSIGLREIIEREDFQEYSQKNELAFIVGMDETNNPLYLSLKELIHIMIVGKSGGGKSVFLNQILTTLLINNTPDELQLLLIDPKQTELNQYEEFPHVQEVITNMSKAIKSFNSLVKEMDRRYGLLKEMKVRDINGYNQKSKEKLPRIVCVVEEWANLYSIAGDEAEAVVDRLGSMARAAGIHLIIVTQRPSAKILSGDIKTNVQNAFSFDLGKNKNYEPVFGTGIPYQLLGKGDGVMKVEGFPKEFQRFQSPIITPDQVEESKMYEELLNTFSEYEKNNKENESSEVDPQLSDLKKLIASTKETRTTMLRRELGIRAEKLTELMNQLVNEGWLIKHKNMSKGYELVAGEDKLSEWSDNQDGGI